MKHTHTVSSVPGAKRVSTRVYLAAIVRTVTESDVAAYVAQRESCRARGESTLPGVPPLGCRSVVSWHGTVALALKAAGQPRPGIEIVATIVVSK